MPKKDLGVGKKSFRLRCPMCGSMPYPQQVENAWEEHAPEVRVFIQVVGGKAPAEEQDAGAYQKKGRGQAKGSIKIVDVTAEHPEIVAEWNKKFAEQAIKFAEQAGYLPS